MEKGTRKRENDDQWRGEKKSWANEFLKPASVASLWLGVCGDAKRRSLHYYQLSFVDVNKSFSNTRRGPSNYFVFALVSFKMTRDAINLLASSLFGRFSTYHSVSGVGGSARHRLYAAHLNSFPTYYEGLLKYSTGFVFHHCFSSAGCGGLKMNLKVSPTST